MRLAADRVELWRPDRVAVDPWTVLRLARYRRREEAPPPVWEAARAMAARVEALAAPVAGLRLVRVGEVAEAAAALLEGPRFSGRAVARHLAGARLAVAFALTLGPAVETEVAALGQREDVLAAYLLDLAGWAGLEAAARLLRQALGAAFPGRRLSHRLGPGHRDWPLEEQAALLGLLDAPDAPVRLSPFGVLVPFKSISGLFAVRDAA